MKNKVVLKIILYIVLIAVICGGLYMFFKIALPKLVCIFFAWLSNDGI